MATAAGLLEALAEYRDARLRLLRLLDVSVSERDPLAEFAERLVAALTGREHTTETGMGRAVA